MSNGTNTTTSSTTSQPLFTSRATVVPVTNIPVDDDKVIYFVDSDYRLSGTHSNFTYQLDFPPNNNFDSVAVLQAAIPKSYYLIGQGRNTFLLREGAATVVVDLPVGNYTRDQLASVTQARLNTVSPTGLVYTVTYPAKLRLPDTGKFNFSFTGAAPGPVQFIFPGTATTPAVPLGFNWNATYTFTGTALESANVCKLQARDIIYLQSDMTENGQTAVLQEIFSNTPDFSLIIYKCGDSGGIFANRKRLRNSRSNIFNFVVTDDDFQQLDLNGINVVFSLVVWNSRTARWN